MHYGANMTTTTVPERTGDRATMRLLLALGEQLQCGELTVSLPDGSRRHFAGPETGPRAELTVHRLRFLRRMLTGGKVGFAEAYIDGDCDSDCLTALLELTARNEAVLRRILEGRPWIRAMSRIAHLVRPNSRRGARRNIAAHYDLGNAFYEAWLDPSMTYSSAVFARPEQDLQAAQTEKYRRIARLADLRPEHRVLEIGCGWGGFAEYAAREIGCHITAITISQAQYDYARQRIAAAGLSDRAEIVFMDYRDLTGSYDRIVSIEMIEAVGESWWPSYFQQLHDRLVAGGRAVLQAITMGEAYFPSYRCRADFIQRYIFPGGMLPAPSVIQAQAHDVGLRDGGAESYGLHYAETLRRWHRSFEDAWPRIAAMGFDGRFRRMWRYYLAYCEAGFRAGRIDLRQIALDRPVTAAGA